MGKVRISWLLYLGGSLLVVGTWFTIVPPGIGWGGWLIALAGWALESKYYRSQRISGAVATPEQIERLYLLRQRNVITEEEFQLQRRRLLEQG